MILADTSVWIDHFRSRDRELEKQLNGDWIVMHPFVAGELALGPLPDRKRLLAYLDCLPQVRIARQDEVRRMIEAHSLHNRGIGLIDAHLLAAVLITPDTQLWTRDTSLRRIAKSLGVLADLP
jgi:predicted nucleic acid-binding protein